jgi:hypothetical protein
VVPGSGGADAWARVQVLGAARGAWSLGPDIVRRQDPLEHRSTPERSLDQRMDALSRANEVRALRAQLKRDLTARRVSIGALLVDRPRTWRPRKVFDMVLALLWVGSVKPTKILHQDFPQLPGLAQQDVRRLWAGGARQPKARTRVRVSFGE